MHMFYATKAQKIGLLLNTSFINIYYQDREHAKRT